MSLEDKDTQDLVELIQHDVDAFWRQSCEGTLGVSLLELNFSNLLECVEKHSASMIVAGSFLANLKKQAKKLEHDKAIVSSRIYHKFTNELVDGKNSSKYDSEYRRAKYICDPEYKELCRQEVELVELITRTEYILKSLEHKHGLMLTMMKHLNNQ